MFFRASVARKEEVLFRQLERPAVSGADQVISKDGDCHGSNRMVEGIIFLLLMLLSFKQTAVMWKKDSSNYLSNTLVVNMHYCFKVKGFVLR